MKFFRDFKKAETHTYTKEILPFVPDRLLCYGGKTTWYLSITPICEGVSKILIKSEIGSIYSEGFIVGTVAEIKALREIKPAEINPFTVNECILLGLVRLHF